MSEKDRLSTKALQEYRLDDQVGFILRQVSQRHSNIFSELMMNYLTPTRFAALAKLYERGPMAQNELGRQTAMDAATIKGVVDRLQVRELVSVNGDPEDGRKRVIELTDKSRDLMATILLLAHEITQKTLQPLTLDEQRDLLRLLAKLS